MDKETIENIREGEKVQGIVESEAWAIVKAKLNEKILDLQSVRNITGNNAEEVLIDIKARNAAIDTIIEIVREIEGRAEQHKSNKTLIREDFMIRF